MRDAALLKAIEAKQDELARLAMEQPAPDLFSYGRACGLHAGLALARQMLLDMLDDRDERDAKL